MTVNTQELRELVEKARWYAVDRYDLATQCSDRDDAHREAESCAAMWPKSAPYRAMQLIDAAAMLALLDEIDALRAELQARQWQPIETAPKDGTEIIVFHPEGGVCAAFCPADGFAWHCMDGENTVQGKLSRQSIPRMTSFVEPPTHWMPLPLPPAPPQGETACASK